MGLPPAHGTTAVPRGLPRLMQPCQSRYPTTNWPRGPTASSSPAVAGMGTIGGIGSRRRPNSAESGRPAAPPSPGARVNPLLGLRGGGAMAGEALGGETPSPDPEKELSVESAPPPYEASWREMPMTPYRWAEGSPNLSRLCDSLGVSARHSASAVQQAIRLAHGAEPCRGTHGPEPIRGAECRIGASRLNCRGPAGLGMARLREAHGHGLRMVFQPCCRSRMGNVFDCVDLEPEDREPRLLPSIGPGVEWSIGGCGGKRPKSSWQAAAGSNLVDESIGRKVNWLMLRAAN